jgi:signal transduction histidine kinase
MITRNKIKKHMLLMLFISIVFFVAAFFISTSVRRYYSPSHVVPRLNSEIADALSDLEIEIEKIAAADIQEKDQFIEFIDNKYKNVFADKGIEILVYENDSLTFWTDIIFAAPEIKDSQNFSSDVIASGSGYYLVKSRKAGNRVIIALQLIRYRYKYSNEYLPSGFNKRFSAPDNAMIELRSGDYKIVSPEGKFLFSLSFQQPFDLQIWLQYLIFSLYITSFLCLIAATFFAYIFIMSDFGPKWFMFILFIIDVIIIRALQFYFRFPADLYQMQLFNPAYFASSDLLPSLGDFLINTILGLQIAFLAYKNSTSWIKSPIKIGLKSKVVSILILALVILLFHSLASLISGLILNSSISFRFENILSLPHLSHVGLVIITILLVTFLFLFELSGRFFLISKGSRILFSTSASSGVIVYGVISYFSGKFDSVLILFLIALFVVLYFQIRVKSSQKLRLGRIVSIVIVLSAMATYLVNKSENIREKEKRVLLATHLAHSRDNLAEYYFGDASEALLQDTVVKAILSENLTESSMNAFSYYIMDNYFSGYWDKYLVQITVCSPERKLNIKPGNVITGCEEYFENKIRQFMTPVSIPGLYFLKQSIDATYYLGKIVLKPGDSGNSNRTNIYVEISSNDIWKGLGYPELLIDDRNAKVDNLYGYSYAFYYKGELVKNVGKYSFDIESRNILRQKLRNGFYTSNGFNHLVYSVDKETLIVLSKEAPLVSDLIAPFSYIFLLLIFLLLVINWLRGSTLNWNIGIHTFRLRLQVIMISVIVVSSVVLVTVSLLFINNLNKNKNIEILNEKLNSILVDLEIRYGTLSSFDIVQKEELTDLLLNLSNTYFTDVNIYNTRGFLLASSRDQIFREGMISEQLNPSGARQLMVDKKSLLIQRENIGTYSFLSAYTPIRNLDNKVIGYLNLPYFARQEEIRREISGLISTFANIYIIMIVITVILALLLSRLITRPLQQIGYQFSKIKMGNLNEKIVWSRKDEIGSLVNEYNRMIDEMARSAELLARSERESAWRQMARQVAHEIKNPLTPIKLSMQLLMRAWNDNVPDMDARLKRFSQTLIMQIDTLSSIATEFSDFAQMPQPQIQQFDIIPLVQQSAALFRDQSDCEIMLETELKECIIKADPNQILRVFNNLIKNALQAIPGDRQGLIRIKVEQSGLYCKISFQDNGTGIPNEKQTRIFSPNFTTKTAGMGLGLAMVKNIIDSTSGKIWFETNPGIGTTFFVTLPLQDTETTF